MRSKLNIDPEGYAHPPETPGNGLDLDWDFIDNCTTHLDCKSLDASSSIERVEIKDSPAQTKAEHFQTRRRGVHSDLAGI